MKVRLTSAIVLVLGFAVSAQRRRRAPVRPRSPSPKTSRRFCSERVRAVTGPDQMAPMSLMTYQDVRPWARSIKQRVIERADAAVGHRSARRHPELQERSVAASRTRSTRSSNGSMPARRWAIPPTCRSRASSTIPIEVAHRQAGSHRHVAAAQGAGRSVRLVGQLLVDTGLTEDRYIKAIESKPGKTAVVHHLLTYAVEARRRRRQQRRRQQRRTPANSSTSSRSARTAICSPRERAAC